MINILKVVIRACKTYYNNIYYFLFAGIITFFSCVLIIPGPFALAGLWIFAHHAVRQEDLNWQIYWKGVKAYGLRAWGVSALILAGYALLGVNIYFYTSALSPFPPQVNLWARIFWIGTGVIWSGIALYAGPFLIELETPSVMQALRNSIYLTFARPIPTLVWSVLSALLLWVGIRMPLILLFSPALVSLISLSGLREQTQLILAQKQAAEEDATSDAAES